MLCLLYRLCLQEKACWGGEADKKLVTDTLKAIKSMGYSVIRIWAFQEDPKKPKLHDRGEEMSSDYNPAVTIQHN